MGRPRPFMPPALRAATLCAVGILLSAPLPDLSVPMLCGGVLLLLGLLLVLHHLSSRHAALAALAAAGACLLLGAFKGVADRQRDEQLPEPLLGDSLQVCGTVAGIPEIGEGRTRILVRLIWVRRDSTIQRTSALASFTVASRGADTVALAYGMRFACTAFLSRPSEVRNPGELSQRQFYDANGICYVGLTRMRNLAVIDSGGGSRLMRTVVLPARGFVEQVVATSVGGEEGAFLNGLLLGDRSGITYGTKEAFVTAGVAHVLAVSGSNVAVVAAALLLLCQLLRMPRGLRTLAVASGILLYAFMTGAQASVVRASVMALILLVNASLQVKSNPLNAVGVAGLIILALDARQLYDVGFQLSFAAVLAILVLYPPMDALIVRVRRRSWARRAVVWVLRLGAVSLAATLGTLPLTAACFGAVSVIGVIANLVVVPLTGISVLLGLIGVSGALVHPWLAGVYGELNRMLLHWTLAFVERMSTLPFASADTSAFRAVDALPYYAVIAFIFSFAHRAAGRGIILVIAAALVALAWPRADALVRQHGVLRVTFIDVGQGDAILAELPAGQTVLVDAGPASSEFDAGARIVVPYLRRRGITKIDLLVITHPHQDHVGGLPSIMRHFPVGRVVRGPQRAALSPDQPQSVQQLQKPEILLGDTLGVRLYCVPSSAVLDDTLSRGGTNSSLVVKLQYGGISFLLPGDAETTQEEALVACYGDFLRSALLKLGHHGSRTSSSEAFLAAVHPSVCVISVGAHNTFGHPSFEVLERLHVMGIPAFRTDRDGAVIFATDGRMLSNMRWR